MITAVVNMFKRNFKSWKSLFILVPFLLLESNTSVFCQPPVSITHWNLVNDTFSNAIAKQKKFNSTNTNIPPPKSINKNFKSPLGTNSYNRDDTQKKINQIFRV